MKFNRGNEIGIPDDLGFLGNTTYKVDYIKYPYFPHEKYEKSESKVPVKTELDSDTLYKLSYKKFDPKFYMKEGCPVSQLPARPP